VKHILRYVAMTCSLGLFYPREIGGDPVIMGYNDSDLARDVDGRKSTISMICFLGRYPVSWQSAKQRVVAVSSCEAEYIAAASTSCQVAWLARLMSEIMDREHERSVLMINNMSAIAIIKNPVLNDRSRHIDIRYHLIREYEATGQIKTQFINTQEQLRDLLTKPPSRIKFQVMCVKVGLMVSSK
jgi:hypothetical protein